MDLLTQVAKWIVICFGLFLIAVGFLMLLSPKKARQILQKAGSTNFINYAEITIRMIPAIALIIYADFSLYPTSLKILGWFMLATSLILYFVPRKLHHNYSLKWANRLRPLYFQMISPFAMTFGGIIIYAVI